MTLEFKKEILKGIGLGLIAAVATCATYKSVKGIEKSYENWITKEASKSVSEWLNTYCPEFYLDNEKK